MSADASAAAELRDLADAGRLVAEYPRAGELVARLSGAELLRAGRLLARLDTEEISKAHPGTPLVTIGVTGHGTLGALAPALTAQLARHGLVARTVLADFDNYVFDLLDPAGKLNAARPDLVLCVLDPMIVFDEVPVPWRPEDVERAAADKIALIERLAARFAETPGTLVLNTMPLLRGHTGQLVDHRSRARLGAVWREANTRLLRLAEDNPSVVVLDLDPIVAQGVPVSDDRLSTYAKAHLTDDLLFAYAAEIGHLARQLTGRSKKCLVLDLDNTLWGGVLGDDGVEGIEVGDGYRGEAFLAFQQVIRQLGSQGVLVAAVSKNEPELVTRALREHPRMALREQDFVRIIANWQPKHDNLNHLAETLGLSVDSFVFVDDSAFERELVRRELPGVAVVDVDGEPAWHRRSLLRDGWFDVREVTSEDRVRASRYRDETARKSFLDSFASTDDYLRELGVHVRIGPVTEAEVPRISQLTLRTNQFNLTADRLQPGDVLDLMKDPAALALAVHAGDRFGDHGLVGAVLARRDGDLLRIDNFLLSCRVFSRSIEEACLSWVLRHARDTGATSVVARYRQTPKNRRVADFYPRHAFFPAGGEGDVLTFRHPLTEIMPPPPHIRFDEIHESDRP
ncbi:HAD-IIIC family phosphatase [Streptomyces sp. ISL-98]|uniref:HAD-IIIC family phosphatase n=1 Tax=Streptomyces sp. ISL-98 TaxID=2819192 RepID=UPI0027E42F8E|nr:HAD-IIIC family phosphatase [Streptomyces sp. ISL-98]